MGSFFRQLSKFPTAQHWWIRTTGWGLTGLAAGWVVSFFMPVQYTSEATVHIVPARLSQDLLAPDNADPQSLLDREKPVVLSRNVLATIVNNFDLYSSERKRMPMEDVIEELRKQVRIELSGTKVIQIAFTYRDRILANKVTQDLVSRFIAESLSYTSAIATESVQFLQDELDKVGKSWLKMSAEVKATKASDPRYELLILARDQKRKEYETVSQKLGAAETLRDLEQRGQGSRLELLDAASMPQEPDTAVPTAELAGLGCGLAVGLLGTLWRALRRTTPPEFSVPRVEPAG